MEHLKLTIIALILIDDDHRNRVNFLTGFKRPNEETIIYIKAVKYCWDISLLKS